MLVRFLLGPSGSGKTFACLAEVRRALLESPEGPPLLFLAPKQATFQLEWQLLADSALAGYTRLQILSFERLAEFILAELGEAPRLLNEEGRLMVLRALLTRHRDGLKLFHATARLRGFAQELSGVLRELQRAQLTPDRLLQLAQQAGPAGRLNTKLHDLATMLRAYLDWLKEHQLQDRDCLLALATEALGSRTSDNSVHLAGLWLDGFAEMSPQEMSLLVSLLPFCNQATLAFNLDRESIGQTSWLSSWSILGQTCRQLRQRLEANRAIKISEQWLERETPWHRHANNPMLHHLEKHWPDPKPFEKNESVSVGSNDGFSGETIRVIQCANPKSEALFAAQEICRFVREGGRFRDVAVIVRNLEHYHDPVRRTFTAHAIPFFLDRREPVGHHPLAELTRSALKTVAFNWQTDDWLGALKTGLIHSNEDEIDQLENEALARGWKGKDWHAPLRIPGNPELEERFEALQKKLLRPFLKLSITLGHRPSGEKMAEGLSILWEELRVGEQLEQWSNDSGNGTHGALWQQIQEWLENLALAFSREALPLREWLPIIEAGLASQTVGVIPPTLDQVLVGAVDRSRNPELRRVILLGMNESVFPAQPPTPTLLTESDRERLADLNALMGPSTRDHLSRERYLGYVACTRPRERLLLTHALRDENDHALNPSPFIAHLQRLFPLLEIEFAPMSHGFVGAEQPQSDSFAPARWQARRDACSTLDERLAPSIVEQLYGKVLRTSVSRLEEFAACPFRFFVSSGLRAEERKQFELDAREQGSFQHEVLARFHEQLSSEGKRWRDLTPLEAREQIGRIAEGIIESYQNGLLTADDQRRFTARSMTEALRDFIEIIVAWMAQYEFDPEAVELAFGQDGNPLPPWRLDLGQGHELWFRGKIDRVDLCREADGQQALCVVMDYKSSAKKLDSVLMAHGVQLQLAVYLNVLRGLPEAAGFFGVERLVPAGVFYVNLRGRYQSSTSRQASRAAAEQARRKAYRHTGLFDASALPKLDNRNVPNGDQFNYVIKKGGELSKSSREALDAAAFGKTLDNVETQLLNMGREIFAGTANVDPFRKGNICACDTCQYQSICRIDPWTHQYRILRSC